LSWFVGSASGGKVVWKSVRFSGAVQPKALASFFDALFASGAQGIVLETFVASALSGTSFSAGISNNALGSERPSKVEHRIGIPESRCSAVSGLLCSLVPGVLLEEFDRPNQPATAICEIGTVSELRSIGHGSGDATTAAVLSSLRALRTHESVSLQWHLGRTQSAQVVASKVLHPGSGSWTKDLLIAPFRAPQELDSEARRALIEKIGERRVKGLGRIAVASSSGTRSSSLTASVFAGLQTSEEAGAKLKRFNGDLDAGRTAGAPSRFRMNLGAAELASLVLWPLSDNTLELVARQVVRLLPPVSPSAASHSGRRERSFAVSNYPGHSSHQLGLPVQDALRHLHLLGPTGTGKSTVMLNLIAADMNAGRGVIVIDPKGDLVRDVLERIPQHRQADVVVIDGADDAAPVGINPLSGMGGNNRGGGGSGIPGEGSRELLADSLLAVFRGLYADSWGPRTEDLLHASLLTLLAGPGATLVGLPLLLTNASYRAQRVKYVNDPLVLEPFWHWYETLSEGERATVIAPLMNKLRAYLLRPSLRRIIGQVEPRFDLRSVFSDKKILLVSLAKGTLGPEGAALLGSLLVSQLWQCAQERVRIPESMRSPVFVYLDEFQEYLHLPTDLAAVLAQSRSLGVGLTLAHQHMRQLPEQMRSAVMSNARSRVCFQLGMEDAAFMGRTTGQLEAKDFQGLDAFNVYASLSQGGKTEGYVSGVTQPPVERCSRGEDIRKLSREAYGVPKASIDLTLSGLAQGMRGQSGDSSGGATGKTGGASRTVGSKVRPIGRTPGGQS
jgi:Type IV secretion-system coupling protein DNA-binding domain/TraM recognition site of TraD and TraG